VSANTLAVAGYVARFAFDDLPGDVVAKAKHHILDTLGAIVVGTELEAGRLVHEFARQQSEAGESTVVASNFKTSCATACLANGTASHAAEVDDLHHPSIQHPGCASVPTALAIGEKFHASGKDFIAAIVLGYEIAGRVARALDVRVLRNLNRSGLGIPPCFASAAVASKLLGLTERQVASALGLAAEQASGTYAWLTEPTHMAKAFDIGVANRNGATSALLSQLGFQGPPAVFDPPHSVFDAFSGGQGKPVELTDGLGRRYDILGATIKKYPVGGPIQAPLEGLLELMSTHAIRGTEIETITVGTVRESVWLVGNRPIEDICMEHVLAAAAHFGRLGWDEIHAPDKLADPAVLALRERVKFVADEALEATFPRIRAASVAVTTRRGDTHRAVIENVHGTPAKPFSQADVEAKFFGLASRTLGMPRCREIASLVAQLEHASDIRELGELLQRPAA